MTQSDRERAREIAMDIADAIDLETLSNNQVREWLRTHVRLALLARETAAFNEGVEAAYNTLKKYPMGRGCDGPLFLIASLKRPPSAARHE